MAVHDDIEENIAWIESGKIGCVFASALVKQRARIGWHFYSADWFMREFEGHFSDKSYIISIVFPGYTIDRVRDFALNKMGMYIEDIEGMYEGLRIKMGPNVSWVQYFGPDSHVKTRQSPHPMLSFTIKLPAHVYAKTMVKGIFHLAHASIEHFTAKKAHTLWEQSFAKTKKELGRSPNLAEAAKTTFVK